MNTTTTTVEDRIRARIEALSAEQSAEYAKLIAAKTARVAEIDAEILVKMAPYDSAIGELTALIDGRTAG